MTRSSRCLHIALGVVASWAFGCGDSSKKASVTNAAGESTAALGWTCVDVQNCVAQPQPWDCKDTENEKYCTKDTATAPGSGDWTCTQDGANPQVVCKSVGSAAPLPAYTSSAGTAEQGATTTSPAGYLPNCVSTEFVRCGVPTGTSGSTSGTAGSAGSLGSGAASSGTGSQASGEIASPYWSCVKEEFVWSCTSNFAYVPPAGGSWTCSGAELLACQQATNSGSSSGGTGGAVSGSIKPGDFRTQTPGGWAAPPAGNNPGTYLSTNFSSAFPNGLVIGCTAGHTATFTSAEAVQRFLPAGGTAGTLTHNHMDCYWTDAGVLGGQIVALTLNVGFDTWDKTFGASDRPLIDLVISGGSCNGMTVGEVLTEANNIVGGCSTKLAPAAINECVSTINQAFDNGVNTASTLKWP